MPYELQAGPQPMVIETGEITWRLMVPYGVARRLRSAARRGYTIHDDGSVRVEVDSEIIEKTLLFSDDVQVSWEGVTSNGAAVPFNNDYISGGMIDSGVLADFAMQAAMLLFGGSRAQSSTAAPANGTADPAATIPTTG